MKFSLRRITSWFGLSLVLTLQTTCGLASTLLPGETISYFGQLPLGTKPLPHLLTQGLQLPQTKFTLHKSRLFLFLPIGVSPPKDFQRSDAIFPFKNGSQLWFKEATPGLTLTYDPVSITYIPDWFKGQNASKIPDHQLFIETLLPIYLWQSCGRYKVEDLKSFLPVSSCKDGFQLTQQRKPSK